MVTRQIAVKGRVQGVGYRDACCRQASRLGIHGWVRNRADGSVEALIQGSEEAVARMLAWARRGPAAARVDELVECTPSAGFQRRYDDFERIADG
jgi:acylphosphatase